MERQAERAGVLVVGLYGTKFTVSVACPGTGMLISLMTPVCVKFNVEVNELSGALSLQSNKISTTTTSPGASSIENGVP